MEKKDKNLLKKILLVPLVVAGSIAISPKTNQLDEITSTYQGYTEDDGRAYLVFDDKKKEARIDFPDLVIEGKPDTLKIGTKYYVKYSIRNGKNHLPKEIEEIRYAK